METEFILYVSDQNRSRLFYEKLLGIRASLHVPGMTEFRLGATTKLGLMPEDGINKILNNKTPHPRDGRGIPRSELYLKVTDAREYIARGVQLGSKVISKFQDRDWGDQAGYISDPDGHIIAFAESGQ